MLANIRRKRILQTLEQNGQIEMVEVSKKLDVSVITIRRDLDMLEKEGVLVRVRGGAVLPDNWDITPYTTKESCNLEQKRAIASVAATMVRPNTSIFLDTGSTMLSIARCLVEEIPGSLTTCTNDLKIAMELGEHQEFTVVSLGGELKTHGYYVAGHFAEEMVRELRADIAFIGCDSVSLRFGAMTSSRDLIPLKKALMSSSRRSVLVCDSSKFGRMSFAAIAPLTAFDSIITDDQLSYTEAELLKQGGVLFERAYTGLGDIQDIDTDV